MHSYCQDLHPDVTHNFFRRLAPGLWPLIYARISFLLNILRTYEQILTKLYIAIYTDKIYVGIVSCHFFKKNVTELLPLIDVKNTFPHNILRNLAFYSMQGAAAGLLSDSLTILVFILKADTLVV